MPAIYLYIIHLSQPRVSLYPHAHPQPRVVHNPRPPHHHIIHPPEAFFSIEYHMHKTYKRTISIPGTQSYPEPASRPHFTKNNSEAFSLRELRTILRLDLEILDTLHSHPRTPRKGSIPSFSTRSLAAILTRSNVSASKVPTNHALAFSATSSQTSFSFANFWARYSSTIDVAIAASAN